MNQIGLAFLTGLTTGGISCMAVQGGLLASSMSAEQELTRNQRFGQVGSFLIAKILAYTILGALLGLLGSVFTLSPVVQGLMQITVGVFMLGTAGRLLNLHPIFRYFVIQPPRGVYKILRRVSKNQSVVAPAFLGFLTVLIPCGVTQAMMVVAVGTGSPLAGAAIMAAFIIGTSPVFFVIGAAAGEILKRKSFSYAAACVIALLGILSINTGQILRGSPHTIGNYWSAVKTVFGSGNITVAGSVAGINTEGKQEVTINVNNNGYSSSVTTIKVGVPVKLKLVTNNVQSCARSIVIPSMKISKVLPQTGTEIVEFTPTKTGRLALTCSMGMYGMDLKVI